MTKQELYDKITGGGVSLAPVDTYTFKQLQTLAAEHATKDTPTPPASVEQPTPAAPVSPTAPASVQEIPTLRFPCSGWCAELNRSYTQGYYKPATRKEYEILRKYAENK